MLKLFFPIIIFWLTAPMAQADLYCYADGSRLRIAQKGTRYSIELLNESLLRLRDPIYMMETLGMDEAEANLIAANASPANMQIDGFERCSQMSTCTFSEIRPGSEMVRCTEGNYTFTAKLVGTRVSFRCQQNAEGGSGIRMYSVTLAERGCSPEPVVLEYDPENNIRR